MPAFAEPQHVRAAIEEYLSKVSAIRKDVFAGSREVALEELISDLNRVLQIREAVPIELKTELETGSMLQEFIQKLEEWKKSGVTEPVLDSVRQMLGALNAKIHGHPLIRPATELFGGEILAGADVEWIGSLSTPQSLSLIVDDDVNQDAFAAFLAELSSIYSDISGGDELIIREGKIPVGEEAFA